MDVQTVLIVVAVLLVVVAAWTRSVKSRLRVWSALSAITASAIGGVALGLSLPGSSTLTTLILCAVAAAAWYGVDQYMSRMDYAEYVESIGQHMDIELQYAGATRIMETGSKWGSVFTLWKVLQLAMVLPYLAFITLVTRFNPAPVNLVTIVMLGILMGVSLYQVVRYTVRSEMVYAQFFKMNPDLV